MLTTSEESNNLFVTFVYSLVRTIGFVLNKIKLFDKVRFIDLLGPFIFTCVNFKEKTNNTATCLIQLGLMPFVLTVLLIIIVNVNPWSELWIND